MSQIRLPASLDTETSYVAIGIKSFGKGIFHYAPVTPDRLSKLRYFQVPVDALALSNIKAWEGAIAVTCSTDMVAIASNRFLFYRPRSEAIDVRYVRYFFLSEPGLRLIGSASPGSADRNRTLGRDLFERLQVPLPANDEQRRIATKLDALLRGADAMAELRRRFSDLLDGLRESLIRRATKSTPEKVRVGGALALARTPIAIDPDETYRVIGMKSFGKGIIHYPLAPGDEISKLSYFRVPSGALLLSNIKAWEGAISVTTEVEAHDFVASSRFLSYMPRDERVSSSYLRHYFLSRRGLAQVSAASPGGADRNRTLGRSRFEALEIPLPPRNEQDSVARILDSLNEHVGRAHTDPALDALRPAILNAAFTGRL